MDYLKAEKNTLTCGGETILLRGFGLGGWFLPEGYMWKLFTKCDRPRRMEAMIEGLCGKKYAEEFWKRYLDTYITEADMELIAAEGFNSVRLPLNARHLYTYENQMFSFVPEIIERVDMLIEWCRKRNIYVILDVHGAPGGQTGQNIDDSENDEPELFMEEKWKDELILLWRELAKRYSGEPAVGGYDLLNEPLPNWNSRYNDQLLPLYRELIRTIREEDGEHLIILEGVHWATDFSIFKDFTVEEAADNIMLQFHKYWSNPDQESLVEFVKSADRLGIPLFMGEGGENNCGWYTTAFPLYERLSIGWSFWSYKKMQCNNSPVTFSLPDGWDELLGWLDKTNDLRPGRAVEIFDSFLACIADVQINQPVFSALNRKVPLTIPCEAYDGFHIVSERLRGAELRMSEPVSLVFSDGHTGEPDFRQHGGEPMSEQERIFVRLAKGDRVSYEFCGGQADIGVKVYAEGTGTLALKMERQERSFTVNGKGCPETWFSGQGTGKHRLILACTDGVVCVDKIDISDH